MKTLQATRLSRSEIIDLEVHLASALRGLLPFTSHSLYFPTSHNMPEMAQWISRERTLLLPLRRQGEDLGVFMVRGVDARSIRRLLPSLPALMDLCLEHLACIKHSRTDELTGLARIQQIFARMEHDADMVRARVAGTADTEDQAPLHKACMGLLVVRCSSINEWALECGYAFADQLLSTLAEVLKKDLSGEVLIARSADDEFTLLLSSATRKIGSAHV